MSNISFEPQKQLSPVLRTGDLPQCERTVAARLAALPHSPFHIILDLAITTEPKAVAGWFESFSGSRVKNGPAKRAKECQAQPGGEKKSCEDRGQAGPIAPFLKGSKADDGLGGGGDMNGAEVAARARREGMESTKRPSLQN